jgi:hypothetical protein
MSRILYGSSNVYRYYPPANGASGLDLKLVQCTKKTVFDAHLGSLGPLEPGSVLVTSVLANFISDACQDLESSKVSFFGNQQITAHVESLASVLRGRPDVQAFVVPPLYRLVPGLIL